MKMDQFETDEQRAEALVEWLKAKGGVLAVGLVVGFSMIGGWHYYQSHKDNKGREMATIYSGFIKSAPNKEQRIVQYNAVNDQTNHVYQDLATLLMAQAYTEEGDFAAAKASLENAIAKEQDKSFRSLMSVRLARVLYANSEYDQALNVLTEVDAAAYRGIQKELEGDILLAKGVQDTARIAYEEAVINGASEMARRKLDHLGGMRE